MNKPKIVVIVGPTSSGKSDLAVKLAKKIGGLYRANTAIGRTSRSEVLGEVISADSRQVYKGLNIGTGKITKKEMQGVKHHLLDVADPRKKFTVSDFVRATNATVVEIVARGNVPIVCGGTAFYIDALLGEKQIPEVPPNEKLRARLEHKSVDELFEILSALDPERAKSIDRKNPRRLTRAIEICKALGSVPRIESRGMNYEVCKIGVVPMKKPLPLPPPQKGGVKKKKTLNPLPWEGGLGVGFVLDESKLKNKINKRLEMRLKKGMVAEAGRLHKQGLSFKRMRELGLEYGALADFLSRRLQSASRPKASGQKKIRSHSASRKAEATRDKKELVERLQNEIWHYAKRQMTWWKRDKEIIWLPPKIGLVEKEVRKFLN